MVAADRGVWAEADAHYVASLELAREAGDTHLGALALLNRAEALLALGQPPAAHTAAEEARGTFEALHARFDLADAERVLGLVERAEGCLAAAETRF